MGKNNDQENLWGKIIYPWLSQDNKVGLGVRGAIAHSEALCKDLKQFL